MASALAGRHSRSSRLHTPARPARGAEHPAERRITKRLVVVYVGIDLHRRTSHLTAFDEDGLELLSRRVTNDPEALRAIFAELGEEARVALEAAFGWEWLADLLEDEGIELHLPSRSRSVRDGTRETCRREPKLPLPK
jgi:hypothetical protein